MIMEEKKKKRRAYLDSFHKNSDGGYDYTGEVYVFERLKLIKNEKTKWKQVLLGFWVLCAVLTAGVIGAGCVTAPGMDNCFYVLIPYGAEFVAVVSVLWAMCRLTAAGNSLKEHIYKATVRALPVRTVLVAVCAGLCILGELVFIWTQGGTDRGLSGFGIFIFMNIAVLASSLVFYRYAAVMEWKKEN